jgi:hypothetical protein
MRAERRRRILDRGGGDSEDSGPVPPSSLRRAGKLEHRASIRSMGGEVCSSAGQRHARTRPGGRWSPGARGARAIRACGLAPQKHERSNEANFDPFLVFADQSVETFKNRQGLPCVRAPLAHMAPLRLHAG